MSISPAWIQASSTVVLVVVTVYYAYQSRMNVRVMSRQLKQERLRYHPEVLRLRIVEWLENLPRVQDADIMPPGDVRRVGHPIVEEDVEDWEGWLWVTPLQLDDDPYFHDLLENHATDLQRAKDGIEQKFDRFWSLRQEFYEDYADPSPIEDLLYPVETDEYFNLWAFERVVLLERGIKSRKELHEAIDMGIERDKQAVVPPSKGYTGRFRPRERREILRCEVVETDEHGNSMVISGADEQVASALKRIIDRLGNHDEYEVATSAANVLDDLNEKIEHLEQLLRKYKGKEIYEGDCEYIIKL